MRDLAQGCQAANNVYRLWGLFT